MTHRQQRRVEILERRHHYLTERLKHWRVTTPVAESARAWIVAELDAVGWALAMIHACEREGILTDLESVGASNRPVRAPGAA